MSKVDQKINLKPLMGYILVKPSPSEEKTASGIILPEGSQEKPAQGEVVAIGEDQILPGGVVVLCPVKLGQTVIYKKWGGDEIKLGGEEYKLVNFTDLMGVIENV